MKLNMVDLIQFWWRLSKYQLLYKIMKYVGHSSLLNLGSDICFKSIIKNIDLSIKGEWNNVWDFWMYSHKNVLLFKFVHAKFNTNLVCPLYVQIRSGALEQYFKDTLCHLKQLLFYFIKLVEKSGKAPLNCKKYKFCRFYMVYES